MAFILSIILVCSLMLRAECHAAERAISEYQWEELTQDKAFGYRTEKEMAKPQTNIPTNNFLTKILAAIIGFFGSSAGKVLVGIIVISILVYTLYRILRSNVGLPVKKPKNEELPQGGGPIQTEDLLQTNWEDQLSRAIREGDFRLAVRYSHMRLLQLLQERHLIHYRTDKTNNDYYFELEKAELRQSFRQLSRQYEYAWYGNYPVQPDRFEEYMQMFNRLKSRLGGR